MNYINYSIFKGEQAVIKVYTSLVLTGATVTKLCIKKPDGTTIVEKVATIDPGDPKYLIATLLAADLNQSGDYLLQAYIEKGTLKKYGATCQFTVHERWE